MAENKTIFTLTADLDINGRLTVKTDGICPNRLFGKILKEIGCQYDEAIINIDTKLILDEDGEFHEDVAENAAEENNKTRVIPGIVIFLDEETFGGSDPDADGEIADPADDDGADGADDYNDSDPDADGEVSDPADDGADGAIADADDYGADGSDDIGDSDPDVNNQIDGATE